MTGSKSTPDCINLDVDCEEDISASHNHKMQDEDKDKDKEPVNDCSNNGDVQDLSKITVEEFNKKQFNSEEEAYLFYVDYAKCVGFGVRRDDAGRDQNKRHIWQRYVCVCEGKPQQRKIACSEPKRRQTASKRIGCLAHLRVKINFETSKWCVCGFQPDHNHALVLPTYTHLIPSHRRMTDADQALISSMLGYGVKAAAAMDFMTGLAGGPDKVNFTRKDVYNLIQKLRKMQVVDGDANSALNYLQGKIDSDPNFFVRHTIDAEQCLQNLFWCDGQSQFDYECFGDVVAFDTTYKINKYSQPFVMFTGVNHHGNNIIFACSLLVDESKETYIWVLERFMEAMKNKKPCAVVTDGDKAMRKAVQTLFPDACHRLCAWHLAQNATRNIHIEDFTKEMTKCMYANTDIDTFEVAWKSLIERFSLSNNEWVEEMYNKRHMWATAYLRNKFFAGIRTTSRCESANSYFKKYLKPHYNLLEFVVHFERGLRMSRHKEVESDFHTRYSGGPFITNPYNVFECHASKIYTRHAFELFMKHLKASANCMVVGVDTSNNNYLTYKINKFLVPDVSFYVTTENDVKMIKCSCYTFESTGISCSHIISVLKYNHIKELPACVVLKRWTREARDIVPVPNGPDLSDQRLTDMRLGSLSVRCNYMVNLASKSQNNYNETREEIEKIISRLESADSDNKNSQSTVQHGKVKDPKISKNKGCPKNKDSKQKRIVHCGICKQVGHTRRTCTHPVKDDLTIEDDFTIEEDENSSSSDDGVGDNSGIANSHAESPSIHVDVNPARASSQMTQHLAAYESHPAYDGFPQSASSLLGLMEGNPFPQISPITCNFIRPELPSLTSHNPFGSSDNMESCSGNHSEHLKGSDNYNPHAFYFSDIGCTNNADNPSGGN